MNGGITMSFFFSTVNWNTNVTLSLILLGVTSLHLKFHSVNIEFFFCPRSCDGLWKCSPEWGIILFLKGITNWNGNEAFKQKCIMSHVKHHLHPGGTSGKEPTCQYRRHKKRGFNPWVEKNPWRRAWLPTPVFLPGESHGQRSLVGYSP